MDPSLMDFITFLLPGLLLTLLTLATLSCLGSSSLLGKRGLSILLCGNVELWNCGANYRVFLAINM